MNCPHCKKLCKNENSLRQHSIRCKENPNAIQVKPSYGNKGKKCAEGTKKLISEKVKLAYAEGRRLPPVGGNWKDKRHSEESKAKISAAMVGNTNGKGMGKRTEYNGITFRSTWEAKVAEYLDLNNISWKYEESYFKLNGNKSYRPDFFVYKNGNFTKLIEVKGYFRKENKEKFEEFKQLYPEIDIELWDKNVLKEMNIL
jgi:hypothetical protein